MKEYQMAHSDLWTDVLNAKFTQHQGLDVIVWNSSEIPSKINPVSRLLDYCS